MKILIIVNSLYGGGAEHVASYLANYLIVKHEVNVATFSDNKKTYPLSEGIMLHDIRPTSRFKVIRFFQRYHNIWRIIKCTNPDIVISFSVSLNYKVLLVNKLLRRKVVVSERTSLSRYISWKAEYARKHLYKDAFRVVFVTHEDCDKYPFNNKAVIYNPLNFEITSKEREYREKAILAVGSMKRWEVKGFDNLLKSWVNVWKCHPDWQLHFLGRDDDDYIHQLAEELGVSSSVKFLGRRDDVAQVMQTKSIYVLSSRYEGFPNTLIEAMSQGCACVAFDCQSGPKEIIQDGTSGLLVKNQDIKDLSSQLNILISNQSLRYNLSENAKQEVKRFEFYATMRQWDDVINKIDE